MSSKSFVLELPEELAEHARIANLDLQQILIDALAHNLSAQKPDIVAILKQRLSNDQVAFALQTLDKGERVLGLHADVIGDSNGFDEPLSDEFWLGEA
jgi:hypothetical protein